MRPPPPPLGGPEGWEGPEALKLSGAGGAETFLLEKPAVRKPFGCVCDICAEVSMGGKAKPFELLPAPIGTGC